MVNTCNITECPKEMHIMFSDGLFHLNLSKHWMLRYSAFVVFDQIRFQSFHFQKYAVFCSSLENIHPINFLMRSASWSELIQGTLKVISKQMLESRLWK